MPRNREEADLFFCSVTPLQNVRNENSGVAVPRQIEESSKSFWSIGSPREGSKEKSDQSVVNYSSCFSFGTRGRQRAGKP